MTEQHATIQPASPAVMRTLSEAARERQNAAAFNAERQRVSARISEIGRTLTEYERTLIDLRNRDRTLGVDETTAMKNVADLIRMAELLCEEMGVPVPDVPDLPPVTPPQQLHADDPLGQPYPSTPWSESQAIAPSPIGDALAASEVDAGEQRPVLPRSDAAATHTDTPVPGGEDALAEGGFHPRDPAGARDA